MVASSGSSRSGGSGERIRRSGETGEWWAGDGNTPLPGTFPGSSAGKESASNAGHAGLISGSERSAGEGVGHPLQSSWASLLAQTVKNLPAMWETWVQSLCWEDPLEKGKATPYRILAWRIPWTEEPGDYGPLGHKELDTTE